MWIYIVLPFVGALIGWLTNIIAIKLLFRPREPILGIQGALPKHRTHFAEACGATIKGHILDTEFIAKTINKENIQQVILSLMAKIKDPTIEMIAHGFAGQLAGTVEKYLKKYIKDVLKIIEFDKITVQKMEATELEFLEKMLVNALNYEFKFIKLSGLVLGFIIGIVQVLILTLFL